MQLLFQSLYMSELTKSSKEFCKVGIIIIPILQVRRLWHREVEQLA